MILESWKNRPIEGGERPADENSLFLALYLSENKRQQGENM